MSEAKPPVDIVERAAAAVRGAAVPDPPAQTMAATLAAVQTQVAAARRARRRRRIMRNVTVCAALLVAVGVGVGLLSGGGSAQASLLEALGNQAKAKSFCAVTKTTLVAPPPGMPAIPEQKLFSQQGNTRLESGDMVIVTSDKRAVVFDTKAKTARTLDYAKGMPQPPKGFLEGAQRVSDAIAGKAKVTAVSMDNIGGKMRLGFKVSEVTFAPGQTGDVTYWLDEEKKLPLRLETVFLKPLAITTTTDFLAFDEQLDPKLFDMTIPADYKQEEFKMPMVPPPAPVVAPPIAVQPQVTPPPAKP